MTHAAATAYAGAATRGQRFSGRRLPWAGHLLAVTARPGQESADRAGCSTRSATGASAWACSPRPAAGLTAQLDV